MSVLAHRCLAERIENVGRLEKEVMAWAEKRNAKEAEVDWRFTTYDARTKPKILHPSIY